MFPRAPGREIPPSVGYADISPARGEIRGNLR